METKKQQQPSKKESKSQKRLHVAIIKQMVVLATSGFGLVAALAWNNVVQEAVNVYIKPYLDHGSGVISLTIYAVGITVLAVTITYQLTKLYSRLTGDPPMRREE